MESRVSFYIKSFICIFVTSIMLQVAALNAANYTCANFGDLKRTVEGLIRDGLVRPRDILIVFDVADTLITPERDFCGISGELKRMLPNRFSDRDERNKWSRLFSIYKRDRKVKLVDAGLPKWIQSLQQRQFTMIALTHTIGGKFGVVDDMEQLRIDNLASLGLKFHFQIGGYPEKKLFTVGKNKFSFNEGVLFTNLIAEGLSSSGVVLRDKGFVFDWFLKDVKALTEWQPKFVVFIDDMLKFIRGMQGAMSQYPQIKFHSVHYTQVASRRIPMNENGKRILQDILRLGKMRVDH